MHDLSLKENEEKEKEEGDKEEKPAGAETDADPMNLLSEEVAETKKVDSDKIKAVTTMVDEFNNIVAKNFSVYGQYDDFSFANSRSADDLEDKLN